MPGVAWKRWNWVETWLTPLIAAIMRAAWLAPLIRIVLDHPLVTPQGTPYPAWLILALLLGASLVERTCEDRPWGRSATIIAGLGVIVFVWLRLFGGALTEATGLRDLTYLVSLRDGFPAPLVVVVITAALWRRGMVMMWGSYDELWRGFVTGAIALGLMMLFAGRLAPDVAAGLWGHMLAFLLCGLLGLAILSVTGSLTVELAAGSDAPTLNRYWLAALSSVVLITMLVGWALGQILSPEAVAHLLGALRPIARLIGRAFDLLLMVIAYVTMLILGPLLQALKMQETAFEVPSLDKLAQMEDSWEVMEGTAVGLPPALLLTLRVLLAAGLIAGIALSYWLAWRKRRRRQRGDASERRELILSQELLLGQLRGLFRRRGKHRAGSPYLPLDDPLAPRQAVRALYQQLLARAKALGRPRPPGATPSAYEPLLRPLAPETAEPLHTLTEAYLTARYAADPPDAAQVEQARAAWGQVEEGWGRHSS